MTEASVKQVVDYFRKREWIMGNGQCPECGGVPESWLGHPLFLCADRIGHEKNCELAQALVALGEKPLMKGDFKSDVEYEDFIDDSGAFNTRPKTEHGCPRYRELNERIFREATERMRAQIERDILNADADAGNNTNEVTT